MESFEKHDLDLTKMLNLLQKLRNNVFEITLYNKYLDKMLSISLYLESLHTIKNNPNRSVNIRNVTFPWSCYKGIIFQNNTAMLQHYHI